jgi:hypothetical protein
VLPLLDSVGAKMSRLEEVVSGILEEGRALAKAVAEHVLLCFRSRDPQVSLEPVAQGPDTETEEADAARGCAVRASSRRCIGFPMFSYSRLSSYPLYIHSVFCNLTGVFLRNCLLRVVSIARASKEACC